MIIRKWMEFANDDRDWPEDGVVQDGDWAVFPGRSVSSALAEILTDLGCNVDPPEHQFEHGWDFHFRLNRVPFWCQVCRIEDYLVIIELRSFFDFRGGKKRLYAELLTRLNEALKRDGRFRNIRWFTQQELDDPSEPPGAAQPVTA